MDYLHAELGVEVFTTDCYSITHYDSDYELTEINKVCVPDTAYRFTKSKFITSDAETFRQMGYMPRGENIFGVSASAHQTLWFYAPPSTFNNPDDPDNYHPKWFYDAGNTKWENYQGIEQVCFTAHGDEEELQLMKEQFLSVMINHQYGLVRSGGRIFIIGNEDNAYRCDCETCTASKAKYGTDNAAALIFCNDLADMMEAWMQTEEGLPYAGDFEIQFLAYEQDLLAPVKSTCIGTDDRGNNLYNYEPIDGLVCNDHVSPFFAPAHMDNKRSIYDPVNTYTRDALNGWRAISDEISVYVYEVDFYDYLSPYDCITYMQEFYQFLSLDDTNVRYLNSEGDSVNPTSPGWKVLTTYLQSVLVKDFYADVDAATDRFFDNYFGLASESMRKYYDAYIDRMNVLRDGDTSNFEFTTMGDGVHQGTYYIYEKLNRVWRYWSEQPANVSKVLNLMKTWLGYIEDAIEDISSLKTSDPALYETIYKRITLERITVVYLLCGLANTGYILTSEQYAYYKNMLTEDIRSHGLTLRGSVGSIEDFLTKWNF